MKKRLEETISLLYLAAEQCRTVFLPRPHPRSGLTRDSSQYFLVIIRKTKIFKNLPIVKNSCVSKSALNRENAL